MTNNKEKPVRTGFEKEKTVRIGFDVPDPTTPEAIAKSKEVANHTDPELGYRCEAAPEWEPRSSKDISRIIAEVEQEPGVVIVPKEETKAQPEVKKKSPKSKRKQKRG